MAARFKAKQQTYLDKEAKATFMVWHPQVKHEGKWCYLPDQNSKTKLVEADDEETAVELAIKAVRELDNSMNTV